MYTLIENFCLGLRRLEIFGRARSLRRGWVTALAEGEETVVAADHAGDIAMDDADGTPVKWDREAWEAKMKALAGDSNGKFVVPMTSGISSIPLFRITELISKWMSRNRSASSQVSCTRWLVEPIQQWASFNTCNRPSNANGCRTRRQ